jgi:A/G-specific adenine glycosylase
MSLTPSQFSQGLLKWFDKHGRHDLPWQKNPTPYRVWVSEIMLQQTQVTTVIPYYQTFLQKFPTLNSLANAPLDSVLHLWTGLGYYARARNLHKCAASLVKNNKGKFPSDVESMMALPGIGKSTAGAILSISMNERAPILDGNVKRVLSRFHTVEGWTGSKETQDILWRYAETYTPKKRIADYTQAIMDLGATICTRSTPKCDSCPLSKYCVAFIYGRTQDFPFSKPKKTLPTKKIHLLLLMNTKKQIWLEQRPANGIWGGLWSFPEFASSSAITTFCKPFKHLVTHKKTSDMRRHTFSHYHLQMIPIHIMVKPSPRLPHQSGLWYNISKLPSVGLAAPVKKLLLDLKDA